MKIALCILVSVVAASAAPNHEGETNDVNWSEISKMLEEMHMLTKNLFDYTIHEAKQGNPELGNELEVFIKQEMSEPLTIMKEAVMEITEKTLTHDKAENYLQRFKVSMQRVGGELQKYLTRLPEANSANIGKKVGETIGKLQIVSHSLLDSFHHA